MKTSIIILLLGSFIVLNCALPVTKTKKDEKEETKTAEAAPEVETALEYERYLKEVVEALESDPEFRKKLDKAPEADIRVSCEMNQFYLSLKIIRVHIFFFVAVEWKNRSRIGLCESSCTHKIG